MYGEYRSVCFVPCLVCEWAGAAVRKGEGWLLAVRPLLSLLLLGVVAACGLDVSWAVLVVAGGLTPPSAGLSLCGPMCCDAVRHTRVRDSPVLKSPASERCPIYRRFSLICLRFLRTRYGNLPLYLLRFLILRLHSFWSRSLRKAFSFAIIQQNCWVVPHVSDMHVVFLSE